MTITRRPDGTQFLAGNGEPLELDPADWLPIAWPRINAVGGKIHYLVPGDIEVLRPVLPFVHDREPD